MPVIFHNTGDLPVEAMTTFGVSVKQEGAVGYFGTGFKYALSILMRNGCDVTMWTGGKKYTFDVDRREVKGEEFDFVRMIEDDGDESTPPDFRDMGFTTRLGRDWEVWMAFRELSCNAMDEGGDVERADAVPPSCFSLAAGKTLIAVSGSAIEECWDNRRDTFLHDSDPVTGSPTWASAHKGTGRYVYYRGIRVMTLQKPALFDWNIFCNLSLTEDRTVKYSWAIEEPVKQATRQSTEEGFLRAVLMAGPDFMEAGLDYGDARPSETFLDVVGGLMDDRGLRLNPSARRLFLRYRRPKPEVTRVELDNVEEKQLSKALDVVRGLGCEIERYGINLVEAMEDESILGEADRTSQMITIPRRTFEMGTKMLAGTLYEEYLHLRHGVDDCTRAMQNRLIDKIISMYERQTGEPL